MQYEKRTVNKIIDQVRTTGGIRLSRVHPLHDSRHVKKVS